MDVENMVTALKVMTAQHAQGIATQGSSRQRLSLLAQGGVAEGTTVIDSVTGQPVQVVSVATVYLPTGVLNALR